MNTLHQLIRQPFRTIAALILLCLAEAFLCLSFGVLLSAKASTDKIANSFVTIALPTSRTERMEMDIGGQTFFMTRAL